jgi:REP element-mobilizing transposase RayT
VPRPPRDQSAGFRHVVARGNRRQPIFLDDADREWFLGIFARVSRDLGWRVLTWCLMTNHFHLVLQVPAETISRGMQAFCGDYAQSFNWRHDLTGHLFQGRFHAEVIADDPYLYEAIRYVDLNPERAGAVTRAEDSGWSGHRANLGLAPPRPFHDLSWLSNFGPTTTRAAAAYNDFVAAGRASRAATATPAMSPATSSLAGMYGV